jgi:outer membrane murein-binding lipoprotein Lpp
MKINKSAGFIVAVCISLLLLSACKDKKEFLTRTWKVEDITQEVEPLENQKESLENWVQGMRDSFQVTYSADGAYKSEFKTNIIKGTWKLNYNSTNIAVTTSTGQTRNYEIKELDNNKFVFVAKMENGDVTFKLIPKK